MKKSEISKMQKELDAVLSKYGVITKNSARYSSSQVNFSLSITVLDNISKNIPNSCTDLNIIKRGLAPIGTQILVNGSKYTIVKSMRVNYLVQDSSNKQYKVGFFHCQPVTTETPA